MSVTIPRVGNYLTYKYPDKKSKGQSQKNKSTKDGEVCEESFVSEYEQVQRVRILSAAHLQKYIVQIRESLTSQEQHWHDRVAAIQMIRSLLLSGAASHNNFLQILRTLNVAFGMCLNDVSRQVVRETCVTMAFLAKLLCNDFEHCAEVILPILINAIPILGKGECATVTLKLIVQHTHSSRLIPPLIKGLSSGNAAIRRECAKVLYELVHIWPAHIVEKRYHMILENIKLRINDTNSETRLNAARIISTLLDRFKDKDKFKHGRRSMSEPRESYTDVVRMTQSNLSETSFSRAVSKIKDETLESLRDDQVQKAQSEPMRRFVNTDDIGRSTESESMAECRRHQALAGKNEVQEVYSSTMEQLSAAMASCGPSAGRSSTFYRSSLVVDAPNNTPQMPAPPNFEWVLLPSYSDKPFSEEETGGAALENPPMPYEKASLKNALDARKCSSHNDSATIRYKKGAYSQSKSVQQIKQRPTSIATRQTGRPIQRKVLAKAAATNFHASNVCRMQERTTYQPSYNTGKAMHAQAEQLVEGDAETTWDCSSSPVSSTPEVCQIQSANQMMLTNTTTDDALAQIMRSASINALSTSEQNASLNDVNLTSTDDREMDYVENGILNEHDLGDDRINKNDYITDVTYQEMEEAINDPIGQEYDDENLQRLEEDAFMTNFLPAAGDNNVSYVPVPPLRMTDALASDDATNASDDASTSNCSVATVERTKTCAPSPDVPAATVESDDDRLPKGSAFKPVLHKSGVDTNRKEGIHAAPGGSTLRHPVSEGVTEKVLHDLGSHAAPEKQKQGLHGIKKLLYLRQHLSRNLPSGNLFHRLLNIGKSTSKSAQASAPSKGAVGKSPAPGLP